MKKRRESDASLWIGLVLGATLGATATIILGAASEPDTNFPRLNLRPHSAGSRASTSNTTAPKAESTSVTTTHTTVSVRTHTDDAAPVEQAGKSLKENDEARTEGAAEAAG